MNDDGPCTILKFGGSSVGDVANWPMIRRAALSCLRLGERPVVVCSAFSRVSDLLQQIARSQTAGERFELLSRVLDRHEEIGAQSSIDPRAVAGDILDNLASAISELNRAGELDAARLEARILSCGELLSTRMLTAWLASEGDDARWLDARSVLQSDDADTATDADRYLSAACQPGPSDAAQDTIRRLGGDIVVTQGFIARDAYGETVVLGRGGSDTSATLLASALSATRVEIWSDVPGLFTADPRVVSAARLIKQLSYDEAEVLAGLGARALHARAINPLRAQGIPLVTRWTRRPDVSGTTITGGKVPPGVKAIAARDRLVLWSMRRPAEWQPVGFMAAVSSCFRDHGLSMDLISSSTSEIRATIDLRAFPSAESLLPALGQSLRGPCSPELRHGIASFSFVGTSLTHELSRFASPLQILDGRPLHMITHAGNDASLSCVIDGDRSTANAVVRTLHETMFSSVTEDETFGATWQELTPAEPPPDRGGSRAVA